MAEDGRIGIFYCPNDALGLGLLVKPEAAMHAGDDDYGGSFRVFKGIESDILLDGALDLQRFKLPIIRNLPITRAVFPSRRSRSSMRPLTG